MSARNNDNKGRFRSVTIGFRVSPEEAYALDLKVNTSGMTKQDYCTKKVLDEEITVHPNIRVQTYICRYLTELTEQLKRLESIEKNNDALENIKLWFIDPFNKAGCRFVIVDAYNDCETICFYKRNGFSLVFSTEQQERDYRRITSATLLSTRLMYYDLMMVSGEGLPYTL